MKINKTMLLVAFCSVTPVIKAMARTLTNGPRRDLAVDANRPTQLRASIQEAPIYDQGSEIMNLAKEVQENLNAVISARKALNLTPTQLAPFKTAVVSLYENNASLKNLVAQAREAINNSSLEKSTNFTAQVKAAQATIAKANAEASLYYATPAGVSAFLESVPAHYIAD
ncbi:MAG: hypothetical protein NTU89_04350 [Candidatus Dependentiae bacterium]|nr:hypothetical protein [Candidatus Dependentiae bacterium]